MKSTVAGIEFDVAIIGGGPAGLSAAIVLGRARRRVVLFDHGKYRNYAASSIHCYLGLEGIAPDKLRDRGREEAERYGVCIKSLAVTSARAIEGTTFQTTKFEVIAEQQSFVCRALILATGIQDLLPQIPGLAALYGRSVHHCPYCDGWEHRDEQLVALGSASSAVELALSLRGWSAQVTACTNGEIPSDADRQRLATNGIRLRAERIARLADQDGRLSEVVFEKGDPLRCDALFFSADQTQSSTLPDSLGCGEADDGLITADDRQCAHVDGLFVAGDLHSDVQMVSVAAAEGVIAGTAANNMLLKQDIAARRDEM
jgi:thioredoxin reductase